MTTRRAPWLGDVLSDAGLTVRTPVGNPVGRGRAMNTIYGVVGHDTVTGRNWTDLAVARLLRDGHANLSGPLSQLGVRRDGTVDWIADGRCNHNGFGSWGNDAIGFECYVAGCSPTREVWTAAQRRTVVVGSAAILAHLGHRTRSTLWNPRVAGHKETDPRRKQDPCGVDMAAVRRDVAALMEGTDVPLSDADVRKIVAALRPVVRAEVAALRPVVREEVAGQAGSAVWGHRIGHGADLDASTLLSRLQGGGIDDVPGMVWAFLPKGAQRDAWSRLSSGGLRYDELAAPHPHDLPVAVEAIRSALAAPES